MGFRALRGLAIATTLFGTIVAITGGISLAQGARYSTTATCASTDCVLMKTVMERLLSSAATAFSWILLVVGIVVAALGFAMLWLLRGIAPAPDEVSTGA